MSRPAGRAHDIEPEADSLVYIDFEDEAPEADAPGDHSRSAWMVASALAVFEAAGIGVDASDEEQLYEELQGPGGEEGLWRNVEALVNAAGWDTWNSDTRFELFPGGTPEAETA